MFLIDDELAEATKLDNTMICDHCGLSVSEPFESMNKVFCCNGCLNVYKILTENNLQHFYELKDSQILEPLRTYQVSQYNFLMDNQFIEDKALITDDGLELRFYIENVSCAACLWLIEKVNILFDSVVSSQMNLSTSVLKLEVRKAEGFKTVCEFLDSLGYKPHLVNSKEALLDKHRDENNKLLKKVAIAGTVMGNIMLLAISVYAGADGAWLKWFGYISGALFLPVLFYASTPFYQNLIHSIQKKTISLDSLVAIAILIGSAASYYSIFTVSDHYYFDSLSALVFLLLASRYYLKKVQFNVLSFNSKPSSILNDDYNILGTLSKKIYQIKIKDIILLKEGQIIPCDGILDQEISYINRSFMTGESEPVKVLRGDKLRSGEQVYSDTKMVALKDFNQSFLASLLENKEEDWLKNSEMLIASQKYINRLFIVVSILSLGIFSYFSYLGDYQTAFNRVLALLIITCPCSLGLGVPLVLTLGLKKLSKNGILVKNANILRQLKYMRNVFIDKTGTLTSGDYEITRWEGDAGNDVRNAVFQIESLSKHPIAKSLVRYLKKQGKHEFQLVEQYQEIPTQGVKGFVNGDHWAILKSLKRDEGFNILDIQKNDVIISTLYLSDKPFANSSELVEYLAAEDKNVCMLTGDHYKNAKYIADKLSIKNFRSDLSPEDKEDIVNKTSSTLMIGDGVNDIKSMRAADISIAVRPNIDFTIDNADICLLDKGVSGILKLLKATQLIAKTVNSIIVFSILYNIIGISLSLMGEMNPLMAALLMPISVFLIIGFSLYRIKKMETLIWK